MARLTNDQAIAYRLTGKMPDTTSTPFTLSDYYGQQPGQQAKIREILQGSTTGDIDPNLLRQLNPQMLQMAGVAPRPTASAAAPPAWTGGPIAGSPTASLTGFPTPGMLPPQGAMGGVPALPQQGGTVMQGIGQRVGGMAPWLQMLMQNPQFGMGGGQGLMSGGVPPQMGMSQPQMGGGQNIAGGLQSLLGASGGGGAPQGNPQAMNMRRLLLEQLFGGGQFSG